MNEHSPRLLTETAISKELVFGWIRGSEARFNTALDMYVTENNRLSGVPDNSGYETNNGQRMLTGTGYCADGSTAYGLAIRKKFPFVQNLRFLNCYPRVENLDVPGRFHNPEIIRIIGHTLLGFSIDQQDFFLDSTYGQVVKEPNRVIVGKLEDLDKHYDLSDLTDEKIGLARYDYKNIEVSGKLIILDLMKNRNINCRSDRIIINGKKMEAKDFLYKALMK